MARTEVVKGFKQENGAKGGVRVDVKPKGTDRPQSDFNYKVKRPPP